MQRSETLVPDLAKVHMKCEYFVKRFYLSKINNYVILVSMSFS